MQQIRPAQPDDDAAIAAVQRAAFGQKAEALLVERLHANDKAVVSLVAELDGAIIGHILFSEVTVEANPRGVKLIGLAPLAVLPERQRRGVGTQLVHAGLAACRERGYAAAVVLGHAHYYPRFGFRPAHKFGLHCEYDVPDDVFMALELTPQGWAGCGGLIQYQPEFAIFG